MIINQVTIVGLGAIGTVYATALLDTGISVRIAVDAARKERYERDGIIFNDCQYGFDYYTPQKSDPQSDLVIIATKSWALHDALKLIEPIVGKHTQILPLLNGVTSEEICASAFDWDRVLYGYFIGHTATRIGNNIKQDSKYRTYFGEKQNDTLSSRVVAVQNLFDRANIPYRTPEDMISSLWQKFIVNIGLNQATAILRCKYGHLQSNHEAHQYMVLLMEEAASVAKAMGVANSDGMVSKAISLLGDLSREDGSSMYQDVMSGRQTEVEIFAETVCALGENCGIDTPYNFHAGIILRAL